MPQLICLVQRYSPGDGRLIREGEVFEVSEIVAESLIRGGIAKKAPAPAKAPEPVEAPRAAEEIYKDSPMAERAEELPDAPPKPTKKRR